MDAIATWLGSCAELMLDYAYPDFQIDWRVYNLYKLPLQLISAGRMIIPMNPFLSLSNSGQIHALIYETAEHKVRMHLSFWNNEFSCLEYRLDLFVCNTIRKCTRAFASWNRDDSAAVLVLQFGNSQEIFSIDLRDWDHVVVIAQPIQSSTLYAPDEIQWNADGSIFGAGYALCSTYRGLSQSSTCEFRFSPSDSFLLFTYSATLKQLDFIRIEETEHKFILHTLKTHDLSPYSKVPQWTGAGNAIYFFVQLYLEDGSFRDKLVLIDAQNADNKEQLLDITPNVPYTGNYQLFGDLKSENILPNCYFPASTLTSPVLAQLRTPDEDQIFRRHRKNMQHYDAFPKQRASLVLISRKDGSVVQKLISGIAIEEKMLCDAPIPHIQWSPDFRTLRVSIRIKKSDDDPPFIHSCSPFYSGYREINMHQYSLHTFLFSSSLALPSPGVSDAKTNAISALFSRSNNDYFERLIQIAARNGIE